jgi:excisionase family DNA binding protein
MSDADQSQIDNTATGQPVAAGGQSAEVAPINAGKGGIGRMWVDHLCSGGRLVEGELGWQLVGGRISQNALAGHVEFGPSRDVEEPDTGFGFTGKTGQTTTTRELSASSSASATGRMLSSKDPRPSSQKARAPPARAGPGRVSERRALRVNEFCKLYGLSRATAYKLMKTGQLRTVFVGGRRLVPVDAAEALISE